MKGLRKLMLGGYSDTIERLQRDVAALRRAVEDPQALRGRVIEALRQELTEAPAAVGQALEPVVDALLCQRRSARVPRRFVTYSIWLGGVALGCLSAFTLANWRADAAAAGPMSGAVARIASASESVELSAILEQRQDGFGLAQAQVSDDELGREVRTRLSRCAPLVGASVAFSVKDGWIWLRGEATEEGRDAASQALADLGKGVVVVNQLVTAESEPQTGSRATQPPS